MAKTDMFGAGDAAVAAAGRATELKKEIQRLVRSIAADEDYSLETIDRAREALLALRELKSRRSSARSPSMKLLGAVSCPEEFRCPLSKELMRDPVIVATGQVRMKHFTTSIYITKFSLPFIRLSKVASRSLLSVSILSIGGLG